MDLEAARFESGQSPSCGRADAGESDLPVKQVPLAERVRIPPPAQHPAQGLHRGPMSALVAQRKERDVPNVEAAGSNPVKGTLTRSAAGPGRRPRGVPGGAPRLQNG